MLKTDILPCLSGYQKEVADILSAKENLKVGAKYEKATLTKLAEETDELYEITEELSRDLKKAEAMSDYSEISFYCKDVLIPEMAKARTIADDLETVVPAEKWPYPSYGDLLFSVK